MHSGITGFFVRVFEWVGRGIGWIVAALLWPFAALGRWYVRRGLVLRGIVGVLILVVVGLYGYFFYVTQFWTGFDPDYPTRRAVVAGNTVAGAPIATNADPVAASTSGEAGTAPATGASALDVAQSPAPAAPQSCKPSEIVNVTAELVDFNVNQNAWISSMLVSKLGFFGLPWRQTPFFDNKAAFQLGVNQVLRRTSTELVDTLARLRGTSQIDQNLQDARTSLAWDETAWYVGWRGPTRPTPSVYREAIQKLRAFNTSLEKCAVQFDARADNLLLFLDRIAGDIGSTSDILRAQLDASDAGWFDPRADDRFWFAYGQLYAYYGILVATEADFSAVIQERNLISLWNQMKDQLRSALNMQPAMISNGNESSFLFPSHLATMGFYLLRVRSQIIELRSVLDR